MGRGTTRSYPRETQRSVTRTARVGGGDARIAIGAAMDVAGELVEDEDERDGGCGEASDHASSAPDSAAASVGAKRADTASSAARCAEHPWPPRGTTCACNSPANEGERIARG